MSDTTKCVCGHDLADHSSVNGTGCAEFRGKALCPCETFRPLAVPAPSEDAVGVARVHLEWYLRFGGAPDAVGMIDALIAAVESRVRAECAAKVTDVLARLSAVPMRSPSPEQMAVLLFANKAMAETSRALEAK